MRTAPRLSVLAVFLLAVMVCAGCASLAEQGLLPDVKARRLPEVHLSPEIVLWEDVKITDGFPFKSLISADGRAHLFLSDKKKQIHHLEVSESNVFLHEIIGKLEDASPKALDAVELSAGGLRVLAGDRQFIRSAPEQKWQELKGNLCARFITAGDNLLCAFIANGKEIGSPTRRDWTVGWFILLPVVFWSDVMADKLVLAQESPEGWAIRAVFDPETKLSALSDFTVGADRNGSLHFLYRASGKSRAFIVAFGYMSGGYRVVDTSPKEIRYARVQYDRFLSGNKNLDQQGAGKDNTPILWEAIPGMPLVPLPYVADKNQRPTSLNLIGSIERQLAINSALGDLDGLIWVYNLGLDDGMHKMGTADMPWINVKINDGQWAPLFEIVTASDLSDSGWRWLNDRGALLNNDAKGANHLLLTKSQLGFWSSTHEMCYFINTGDDWSAPLVLGSSGRIDSQRSLAVDAAGRVFAAWQSRSNRVVGRWILPKK